MERYICIHGHFYQPPRENPWLEAIQLQDPAYPYHDWNERITAECYAPNSVSRVLDDRNRIVFPTAAPVPEYLHLERSSVPPLGAEGPVDRDNPVRDAWQDALDLVLLQKTQ